MEVKQIDEAIINGVNAGSEKAFAVLYHAYYVYLNAVCFYWLGNDEASREVVNDVFMQIWNRRGTLSFPIHSYLVKAAQNGSIDYLRAQQSRQRTLTGHKEQVTLSYQENYIRATPEPLQYVELREAEEEIRKATEGLPPKCREIFKSHFYENRSVEEIALDMDIKASTVRVQLKNALDRLREQLGHIMLFFSIFI